jgi:hypothetical protein
MTEDDLKALKKFYGVATDLELIVGMDKHIEKLQKKIRSTENESKAKVPRK